MLFCVRLCRRVSLLQDLFTGKYKQPKLFFGFSGSERRCSDKLSLTIVGLSMICDYELCNPFRE
jgi:hypothetical protein